MILGQFFQRQATKRKSWQRVSSKKSHIVVAKTRNCLRIQIFKTVYFKKVFTINISDDITQVGFLKESLDSVKYVREIRKR